MDLCVSFEFNKRKCILYDYRRLFNFGYLDDYVCCEGRFLLISELEVGVFLFFLKIKMKFLVNGVLVVFLKGRYLCEFFLVLGDRWVGIILIFLKIIIF